MTRYSASLALGDQFGEGVQCGLPALYASTCADSDAKEYCTISLGGQKATDTSEVQDRRALLSCHGLASLSSSIPRWSSEDETELMCRTVLEAVMDDDRSIACQCSNCSGCASYRIAAVILCCNVLCCLYRAPAHPRVSLLSLSAARGALLAGDAPTRLHRTVSKK